MSSTVAPIARKRSAAARDLGVDAGLAVFPAEALLHNADAHAADTAAERLGIVIDPWLVLPGIKAVLAGDNLPASTRYRRRSGVIGPVWSMVGSIGMMPV